MTRDAQATRARILDAAVQEFSAHGLAGARVESIARTAKANKRLLYVHYGSKDELFAATLEHVLHDIAVKVPLTVHDLPDYAGRLFDYLLEHPHAVRLGLWRRLERPAAGPDQAGFYADHVGLMNASSHEDPAHISPTDMIIFVAGLVQSWFIGPDDLLVADGSDPHDGERLAAHRTALVEATRRITSPGT